MPKSAVFTFDASFQEKIVKILYQEPDFAATMNEVLKPDYFSERHHRWVAGRVFWSLKANGSAITPTILLHEAQKAVAAGTIKDVEIGKYAKFISGLKVPVPDKTYIKQEAFDFCKNQNIVEIILRSVDEWLPQKKFDEIHKSLIQATEMDIRHTTDAGMDLARDYERRQERREKRLYNGITTGTKLDSYMEPGGLPPNSVGLAIAPTGRGKTNWLIHLAFCAALDAGVQVVYYSLELDKDMLGDRFDARAVGMPLRLLKKNGAEVKKKWISIHDQLKNKLLIKEFPADVTTAVHLRQHLRSLERKAFYPKLIILDHVDLLGASVRTGEAYQDQGQSMLDFRNLVKERGATGWTASQGNRASMEEDVKKNPGSIVGLQHTGDSIKKAQHADFAIGLSQTQKQIKEKRMNLSIAKNRFGATGVDVSVKVDHEMVIFKDA